MVHQQLFYRPQGQLVRMKSLMKKEYTDLFYQIITKFQTFKKSFLIVIDNADDLIQESQEDFSACFNKIMEDTQAVKVIFSSSYLPENLENCRIKKLRPLSREASVDLFFQKVPFMEEEERIFGQIEELHAFTKEKDPEFSVELCDARHCHDVACMKEYLLRHPLTELLGGQPLSISLIAP